mgnify:CR=1 FL=1
MRIIISDPAGQADAQFGTGFERMEIDALVFQRSPQAFDEDVVHPATATVHADPDLGILEQYPSGGGRLVQEVKDRS